MNKNFIEDSLVIRSFRQSDIPTIFSLIERLAIDQGKTHEFINNPDNFRNIFNNPSLNINVIMAEYNKTAIGICLYFFSFSTWRGETGIYIQDLFVDSRFRKNKIGKKLIDRAIIEGSNQGATYLRLAVNSQNKTAQNFYSSIGLAAVPNDMIYAAYGQAFKQLRD